MAIYLNVSAAADYRLRFTISSDAPVLISKNEFEISKVGICSNKTTSGSCRKLKSSLEQRISEHFEQAKDNRININPALPYLFEISLADLQNHPYFEGQPAHCFAINIKIGSQDEPVVFQLNWYPFEVIQTSGDQKQETEKTEKTPIIDNPPPDNGASNQDISLRYKDVQPFYLNVAKSSNLRFWIIGANQDAFLDNTRLNATVKVEFVNTEVSSEFCQHFAQQFKVNDIKLSRQDNDETLIILPITNPNEEIKQDTPATLKITLTSSTNEAAITCEILVLFQRPAFSGHIALDLGTTNSAIAYFDPSENGVPDFPPRKFSASQLNKINTAIHQLIDRIEKQANADSSYKAVKQQLVHFARMMWTNLPAGNQVKTTDDIRQQFIRLKADMTPNKFGELQSKLLVSWGVTGYQILKRQAAPLVVLNFVAQEYFNALNQIIDIDLKQDAKLGSPELEPGRANGRIPSDIKMKKLCAVGEKSIDGLRSTIDMGETVRTNLVNPDLLRELPDLPSDGREKHNVCLSGVKRGLGLKKTCYFIDEEGDFFIDTYDPLCTAAVKELFTRTEAHLNKNNNELNQFCINDVVVTYPANLPQYRRESYRKILQSLGVSHIDMSFDEATAGALYYVWRDLFKDLFAGIDGFLARSRIRQQHSRHPVTGDTRQINFYYQNILLYDLGGGTTDIALLEIGLEEIEDLLLPPQRNSGSYFIIRPKILGLTGREDFGGDNVTLAVFRIIKSKLASTAAKLLLVDTRNRAEYPLPVQEALNAFELHQKQKIDIFTQWIEKGNDINYDTEVPVNEAEDGIAATSKELRELIDALVTTRFENNPERQSIFFGLWQEAERIKKALSTPSEDGDYNQVITANPNKLLPAIQHLKLNLSAMQLADILVTAQEMESLVRQDIKGTFEKARNLCVAGNKEEKYTTKYQIDRLILAGSSSHLRLVREEMPAEILAQPFEFDKANDTYNLSAPFKHDGFNLEFSPKDAKLAVVYGAALPSYFKTTRVAPQDPKTPGFIQDGKIFLDFDVDNLRNYMPFTLIYAVGTTKEILFESGQQMRETNKSGKAVIRTRIPGGEVLRCYRVDNKAQIGNTAKEQYYAKFPIREFFIQFYEKLTGEKLGKNEDKKKLDDLMAQYLFWAEFDIERNLKCFMYSKREGNDDDNYVNQVVKAIDQRRIEEDVIEFTELENGQGRFNPNFTLWCPVGNTWEKIKLQRVSETLITAKVSFRQTKENKGGITRFALKEDDTPVWQIDLQDYTVKNQAGSLVQPELHIQLEFKEDNLRFTYTVYDPDLNGDNFQEIEMDRAVHKVNLPFNPFRGEE